jgi:ribosomal protein S18 acetylase RimI-like enzyme
MQIRRVSENEVDVCLELFLRATNDLEAKRGDSPIAPEDVTWLPASIKHLLSTDPERVLFAVKDDEPVGLGAAYQREDFWFLSYLEILPGHQGIGVGRAGDGRHELERDQRAQRNGPPTA